MNDEPNPPTRWHKGMPSSNPKGRPKMPKTVRDVRDLAREHTPMAIEVLARVANNPKSLRRRQSSSCNITNRQGLGKSAER